MDYYDTPEWHRLKAQINRQYAERCTETFARTGRASALNSAQMHERCAEMAERRASAAEEKK